MEDCSKSPVVAYTTPNFGPEKLYKEDSDNFKTMDDVFYHIPEFNYNFGDFIICPYYDREESKSGYNIYCISKNDNVVKLNNESEYQNWTIPYSVTKYLKNACLKFKNFPWITKIYIRYDDKFIRKNLNTKKFKILKKWNWKIMLSLNENKITIQFDNKITKTFNINKKLKTYKLLHWYESSKLEQSKIDFEIDVPLDQRNIFFKKLYFFKSNLPFTWNLQEIIVTSKEGFINKNYELNGPKKLKDKITKLINKFFNNFNTKLNFDS
tara:strand:+ start:4708 stop:5508 length:801 start_codon:yes stop_codon:yes gene_type:complete